MAYGVRSKNGKWEVFNRETGKVWASHSSKAVAQKQQGVLNQAKSNTANRKKSPRKKKGLFR